MGILHLHRNIKIRLLDSFLSSLLGSMLFPFMTIYFAEKIGGQLAGLLMTGNVLVGLLISFYGGYVADRLGRKKVALIGETLRLLAFTGMAVANSPWLEAPLLTLFLYMLNTACWGLTGPAYEAMLIDVSTPDNRKLVYSLQYGSYNFTGILGGVIGGFFFADYRFQLFAAIALSQVVTVGLLLFFIQDRFPVRTERPVRNNILGDICSQYRSVFVDKKFMTYVLASMLMLSIEFMNKSYTGVRLASEREDGVQHSPVVTICPHPFKENLSGVPHTGVKQEEHNHHK